MTIGEKIKQCRTARGLTLLDVAEYLGVKEATVQRYESGSIKNLKQETISALADLFQVSPAYLMGWEHETDPIISRELNMPQEVINKLRLFSRTIDRVNGISLMDVLNVLIVNDKFDGILKSILTCLDHNDDDWEKLSGKMSKASKEDSSVSPDMAKSIFCYMAIKDFDTLFNQIINSDIPTYYKVKKTNDGLIISRKAGRD